MGFQNPNDTQHPLASTPFQVHDELALSIRQSGDVQCNGMIHGGFSSKADLGSLSLTSFPITPSPLENVNAPFQSYPFMPEFNDIQMDSRVKFSGLHDQHIATNSINVSTIAPSFFNPPTMLDPSRNTGGIHHPVNDCNMLSVDSLMNQDVFYDVFQNPGMDMNFLQTRGNVIMEETKSNSFKTLKTAVCPNMGNIIPRLEHAQNIIGTETRKAFLASNSQSCTPKTIDGSFLTLGIGGNTEQRSRNAFSTKEIASKLDGTVSPHFNNSPSPQMRRNSSSLPHSFAGGNDAYGVSSTTCIMGHRNVSASDDAVLMSASSEPSPNSFPFPLTALSANQPLSYANNGRNSDFVGKTNSMYIPMDRAGGVMGDQVLSSLTFSNTNSSPLGSTKLSDIALESFNNEFFTPKIMSEQLQSYPNSVKNMPPEPSMNFCIPRARGGSVGPNHFGKLGPSSGISQTQTVEDGLFPFSAQPIGYQSSSGQITSPSIAGNDLFPQRIGVHIAENSVVQPANGNQFPKRLGLQLNGDAISQAGQEWVLHKEAEHAPQNVLSGKLHQLQNRRPAQLPTVPAKGPSSVSVPIQINRNPSGPDFVTGHGIPTAKVNAIPQASETHGQPSLKRKAYEPPPISQRKKIVQRPVARPPGQSLRPRLPTPSPALPLPHVKWQGCDGPPKPSGHKCLLCKRDVAFSPDGPVHQPSIPPAVAVLPCGHVFHDHCLHIITPENQSHDPPCIPCAIGET
nr:Mediator of RNA polymerase II transcription subunit 1 like [Ipomoea batatas]